MQKFSKEYLRFWEKLKIAQAKYYSEPSENNLKELERLKSIKWSDSTRYTKSYLKEHKTQIGNAKRVYGSVTTFFNYI